MKKLLAVTAVVEVLTGIALIIVPSLMVKLFFAAELPISES